MPRLLVAASVMLISVLLAVALTGDARSESVIAESNSRPSKLAPGDPSEIESRALSELALHESAGAFALSQVESNAEPPKPSETISVSGRLCRVEWEANLRQLIWSDSGALYAEGVWIDGKRESIHRAWHESGVVSAEESYSNGKREGVSFFFADATLPRLIARGAYKAGCKDGVWIRWYSSGEIQSGGSYRYSNQKRGSVREGSWVFITLDGHRDSSRSGWYQVGERVTD